VRLRTGTTIAILGAPNAGKSSLLNELAGRDVAIVSEHAGTTRDILEIHLDLGGYAVSIADTAGIREALDNIEAEGIARARRWAEQADLKLILIDPASPPCPAIEALIDDRSILVMTKADLRPAPGFGITQAGIDGIVISVRTGTGIDDLLSLLTRRVAEIDGTAATVPPTRERHRLLLQETVGALARFGTVDGVDLASEELRIALRSLGRITGRIDAEALLDVIFREFCIGK
jgi:tRNA modification GTPase